MDDVRARFGSTLRVWRHRRHLTQEQLAERSGLSYKFIGEMERGVGNPTLETLFSLARELELAMADLVAEARREPAVAVDYRISPRQIQTVREAAASLDALAERLSLLPDRPHRPKRRRG